MSTWKLLKLNSGNIVRPYTLYSGQQDAIIFKTDVVLANQTYENPKG